MFPLSHSSLECSTRPLTAVNAPVLKKCSKSLNQEVSSCFFHSHKVRKKTFRGLYTKWDSFTPRKYKINLIRTLTYQMLSLIQDLRPFVVAAICLRRLLLQNGYPQGIITYQYINDVTKRTINKSNNHVSTVPKKTVIIPLTLLRFT